MDALWEQRGPEWQPDEAFFRDTVALALIFKSASAVVRKARLQSYGAQVTAYTVAKLAADYREEVDLPEIWDDQSVPERIVRAFCDWVSKLHAEIVASAGKKTSASGARRTIAGTMYGRSHSNFPAPNAGRTSHHGTLRGSADRVKPGRPRRSMHQPGRAYLGEGHRMVCPPRSGCIVRPGRSRTA